MADILEMVRSGLAPHYTVVREIGAGGMAQVFLAHERTPPRKVAVKVMMPGLNSAAFRARFTREIELTSVLQHPHIVPILAAEECLFVPDSPEDLCYYVMPYVEGESLRHRLLRERLPLAEALKILREVAGALQYAHVRQIIHRDLKPENILLDGAHALLADFGVARAISAAQDPSLTSEGVAVGSLAYMSPEQMVGTSPLDARTDIYALGCVFHEMITGTTPLLTPGSSSRPGFPVFRQALLDQGIGRAVIRGLEQVLCQALCPEPEDRYPGVERFTAGLEHALHPSLKDRLAALLVTTRSR